MFFKDLVLWGQKFKRAHLTRQCFFQRAQFTRSTLSTPNLAIVSSEMRQMTHKYKINLQLHLHPHCLALINCVHEIIVKL